jgi:simple sugar transport system substrate-binding protein
MVAFKFPPHSSFASAACALALSFVFAGSALAADTLNIVFTCHSSTTNSFWQAVKLGFEDACSKVGAKGQYSDAGV